MIYKIMNINELDEKAVAHYFPLLTEARREKILSMEDHRERNIAFCAEILSRQCLSELCDAPEFSFSLLCNPNGRSVVGNFDAELSLYAEGDVVACAVSHNYIGIGLSAVAPFSFKEAQNWLTDSEIRVVFSDSGYSFTDIINQPSYTEKTGMSKYAIFSSLKEAHFGASGRGVRADRKKVSFEFNGTNMICTDVDYYVLKSYIDRKEVMAVSVIERCKK